VLRRFEIYSVRTDAGPGPVRALETACRRSGDFIPEVLHSKVGWNLSDAPAQLVWEHAFASAEAYQRYMVHPYHAAVLDRYLLHDSPERVVTDNDLGAGLVGYHCDGPAYDMAGGVRRLVLLRVDRQAAAADVRRLTHALSRGPADAEQMNLSVVGTNTLGSAWFDAVTAVGGPPRWTHLWEQGFTRIEDLDAYRQGDSPLAEAERRGWDGWMNGVIHSAVSLHYEIDVVGPVP
jgi:hypothetical protein